jgi:hypothetical protein
MLFRKTLLFMLILLALVILLPGCVSSQKSSAPDISSSKVSPTFQNSSPYPSASLPSASPSKTVPSPSGSTANMPVSSNVSGAWTLFNIGHSRYFAIYGKELWIETEDEITIWNPDNNNVHKIPFSDSPILLKVNIAGFVKPISDISSFIVDNTGNLWIGTHHSGLCCFDGQRWKIFTKEQGIGKEIEVIFKDKEGRIWVGSENGISAFDGQKWQIWTRNNAIIERTVYGITQDAKGHIWYFTSNNNICYWDGPVLLTTYITSPLMPPISNMTGDKQGYIWFSTGWGAYRNARMVEPNMITPNKEWKIFTKNDGLADNIEDYIFCDNKGNVWFATSYGVTCFDGTNWKTYNPFVTQAGYYYVTQDDEGYIWIGCRFNGICRYHPD